MCLEKLKETYCKKGVVLALGAGVSMGAGIPLWRELLKRIGDECLDKNGGQLIDEMINDGYSLTSIAGMLKASCPKGKAFPDIVRDALYDKFPFYRSRVSAKDSESLVDFIQTNNQTLNAVAGLCAVRDKLHIEQKLYVPNPRIHAIINFNIDTILRKYIEIRYPRKNGEPLVRTVERASKSSDADKISVYHVHGNLRFDLMANRPNKEGSDKLVFAEQEYFDFFNSPTSLFNYTFLYMLREYSFLFIGLSMQDDNIRRLLHYSRKERLQAYEEEKKGELAQANEEEKSVIQNKIESKALRHFAILKKFKSAEKMQLIEKALNYLGTRVLWINSFDEDLPKLLGDVYKFGGDDWSTVCKNFTRSSN